MNPILNDSLRALAGIAISDKLTQETRDRAELIIHNIMDVIEKNVELETKVMDSYKNQASPIMQ